MGSQPTLPKQSRMQYSGGASEMKETKPCAKNGAGKGATAKMMSSAKKSVSQKMGK